MRASMQKSTSPVQHRAKAPSSSAQHENDVAQSPRVVMQRKAMGDGFGGASAPVGGGSGGLPGNLTRGIAALSGMDVSDVSVFRNSSKPAQFKALAFAQDNAIHLGPGQEKHLPHEAWHIVQQRQGRVKADMQMKGGAVNTNAALEREADIKGAEAAQVGNSMPMAFASTDPGQRSAVTNGGVVQLNESIEELRKDCVAACNEFRLSKYDWTFDLRERDPYDALYDRHYVGFADQILAPVVRDRILPQLSRVVYTKVQKDEANNVDKKVMNDFKEDADGSVQAFINDDQIATNASTPTAEWRNVRAKYVAKQLDDSDKKDKKDKKNKRDEKSQEIASTAIEDLNRQIVLEDLMQDTMKINEVAYDLLCGRVKKSPNGRLAKTLAQAKEPLTKLMYERIKLEQSSEHSTNRDELKQIATRIRAINDEYEQVAEKNIADVQEYIGNVFAGNCWELFKQLKNEVKRNRKSDEQKKAIRERMTDAQQNAEHRKEAVKGAAAAVFEASLSSYSESWGREIQKELKEIDTSVMIDLKYKMNLAVVGIPGVYVQVSFKGKASRDEKGVTCALTGSIGAGVGIRGLFDLNLALSGYVKGKGKDATHALDLMFYALYRRALGRELPESWLDYLWGRPGIKGSHQKWAAAVESEMGKGHSAESGVKIGIGAGIGGKLLGAETGASYNTGTKYAVEKGPKEPKKNGDATGAKNAKNKVAKQDGKLGESKIVASENWSYSWDTSINVGPLSAGLSLSYGKSKAKVAKGQVVVPESTFGLSCEVACGNYGLASSSALIKAIFARALEYAHRRMTIYFARKNKEENLDPRVATPEKKLLAALKNEAQSFATGAGKQELREQYRDYRGLAPKQQGEKPLPIYLNKNANVQNLQVQGYQQPQIQLGQQAHDALKPHMDQANQFNQTMKMGVSPQLDSALTAYKPKGSTSIELSVKFKTDATGSKLTIELTMNDQAPKTIEALRMFKFLKVEGAKSTSVTLLDYEWPNEPNKTATLSPVHP